MYLDMLVFISLADGMDAISQWLVLASSASLEVEIMHSTF